MDAPTIRRQAEQINTVADFATLVKDGEKGVFPCGNCGAVLNDVIKSLPNDGNSYVRPCPGCQQPLYFNAAWLAAKVLAAQQLKLAGRPPVVMPPRREKGRYPKERGEYREEALPDGRKRIIVTPAMPKGLGVVKLRGEP
jgi:hypothetical protein